MISSIHTILSIVQKRDDLGWTPMTLTQDDVYPDLVAHVYTNATRGLHSDAIKSYVKGVEIELDRSVIRKILGMGFGGEVYGEKIKRKKQLKVVYGEGVNIGVQPKANTMSLKLRLVHHFVCTMLIPKTET